MVPALISLGWLAGYLRAFSQEIVAQVMRWLSNILDRAKADRVPCAWWRVSCTCASYTRLGEARSGVRPKQGWSKMSG
ncbi:uncharacterized protein EI90DRAFT_3032527 [Cantharellus anzutake]|uniref:uncharacterized protein n=1 Tax=Cantharellus anzutake TaxID=1750568 RepID=UPI001903F124|nr:uncharacterized protein EI90DRAFT_3032527 [Cantharellus anzutake]KAF8342231.1 hypothetical protein EI90DRAFT_3032527 [Cantharellus anzutake]